MNIDILHSASKIKYEYSYLYAILNLILRNKVGNAHFKRMSGNLSLKQKVKKHPKWYTKSRKGAIHIVTNSCSKA